ncbi:sulfite exporter TauE/SafE family protein [Candidatus Sulfidibacterium hydrothermale]|uniref:sulfite exporter TauE/SafE family protein n=1 Tax=Candidatus Sulfidibacterium hydrothermale TaxID=2875962 RepID=UPI001F0A8C6E|nr:sulfite exporter TauE/SafE family protein [Candidatus Sulfidibacterium hydrothermale]UBM62395.1 sulfite exporter TauE/SafE family protein [Candidatus Sulfidibacterium hydrothermale]
MDLLIFGISLVGAFIFALGGVGAAIILIPIMVSMGIPITTAKPVGLFYNTVSLAGASISNIKNKLLDFKTGIPIIIFSFLFAAVGAYASKFVSQRIVLFIFIAFLIFSGLMFLFFKTQSDGNYREDRPLVRLSLIGIVAGFLSGLLGIGGGGIISPLMLMMGFNPKKIAAITAFVVPFSAFSGFITYWMMGAINWKLLFIVSAGGIIGATLGTIFMQKKLNPKAVKKILAVILLLMAIKMIWMMMIK